MRRHLRPLIAVTGAAALLFTAACSGSQSDDSAISTEGYPITLTNCDTEVTVKKPIERAVAINQPAVELMLKLGLKDRMAGIAYSDDALLPEVKDDAKSVYSFDKEYSSFESVLNREPNFVYTTFDYTFTREGTAERSKFTELGIPTYQSPSECGGQDAEQSHQLVLDDLYSEINDVAKLMNVPDKGNELVTSLKDRAAKAAGGLDASNVSLAWWYAGTKTPYLAGCCGAPGLMTRALGAKNAFDDNKQYWPEINWEAVLDRDPTVLVLGDLSRGSDGDSAKDKIAFLESDPVASKLTAVKNKRYIIVGGTTLDPSIRNVTGIEQVADGLRKLGLAQ